MAYRKDLPSDTIRDLLQSHEDDDPDDPNSDVDITLGPDSADELDIDSEHNSDFDIDNTVSDNEDLTAEDLDSEEENNQSGGNEWRKWVATDVSFKEFNFSDNSGFKPPPEFDRYSVLDYFSLFFTDDLLEQIVKETNRYANDKINQSRPLPKKSMWWSWTDVTLSEFKAFLGVILNMGMSPKSDIDDFFTNDWLEYQPFFKDVFPKERFLQIFWNLHLNPPEDRRMLATLSRSAKVRNVVLYLDNKFREYYTPSKHVSIDESTVGFKGKVVFKVYNKDKPQKWGIKIFVMSDATNAYVCAIEPYLGKTTTCLLVRPDLLVTSRVVLTLVNKLEQSGQAVEGMHIFTDRFYTSVELAEALYEKRIHLTGTVKRNRKGLPEDVKKKKKLKKGEINAFRKDNKLSVIQWQDKREVLMLSSLYDNSTEEVRRTAKGGVEEVIKKPTVICRYNESMGGVDVADHFISSYSFTRRSIKWWRKIFFWLLEVAVVNSFILYNTNRDPGIPHLRQKMFRKELIRKLVGNVRNTSRKRGRPSNIDEDERLNGKLHLIYELEDKTKKKDCVVCTTREQGQSGRKRTRFYCKTCAKQPGLHPGMCFERYHTLKKFKAT